MSLKSFMDPAVSHWEPGGVYELCESEAHHVRVMRFEHGESIQVVDGAGRAAIVTLERVDTEAVSVKVEQILHTSSGVRVGLIQALSKNDRDLQAVETCVEIGADAFIPWQADRSIVRWRGDRAAKAHQKWVDTAVRATKQSRRAEQPVVGSMVTTKQLVKAVSEASERGVLVAVCHEDANDHLATVLASHAARIQTEPATPSEAEANSGAQEKAADVAPEWDVDVMLAVGPEGGISPDEVASLTQAGAVLVSLGPHILRASTAGAVGTVLTRHVLADE
ncbi:16S rRNA (uracil(1498)-N(3))-methyltransferase [Pseudoglutamicibacter albus]|uniref:16S rRNA (uracil(1498)-N(3))-methyltransferase n=1 Tax=Pseudoglutamicibacter TaxID=1742991 RepID=UPI001F1C7F72|nr:MULTISPECIES: 16S rRNA (uracil(1498)-N(3))-methyltransferase [Pseudoglutamicibacter]WIK84455.1 16S rRNA (uracil(1498)-N(3))-methyltransferase [Pseudoglutamicibacter albus]